MFTSGTLEREQARFEEEKTRRQAAGVGREGLDGDCVAPTHDLAVRQRTWGSRFRHDLSRPTTIGATPEPSRL